MFTLTLRTFQEYCSSNFFWAFAYFHTVFFKCYTSLKWKSHRHHHPQAAHLFSDVALHLCSLSSAAGEMCMSLLSFRSTSDHRMWDEFIMNARWGVEESASYRGDHPSPTGLRFKLLRQQGVCCCKCPWEKHWSPTISCCCFSCVAWSCASISTERDKEGLTANIHKKKKNYRA